MSDDTRDRVIALERDMEHQRLKLDEMSAKVNEMHLLLTQARGARWAILTVVAIGGFLAGKLGSAVHLFR